MGYKGPYYPLFLVHGFCLILAQVCIACATWSFYAPTPLRLIFAGVVGRAVWTCCDGCEKVGGGLQGAHD